MNSILQYIEGDLDIKSSEVRQLINHPSSRDKLIVLVEGDDDVAFYQRFFNASKTKLHTLYGCRYFNNVLSKLNPRYGSRLIAIKDADFDHLNNATYDHTNLFLTDCHDCEMLMISPERVAEIANEYGLDNVQSATIHDTVVSNLSDFSFIKWFNSRRPDGQKGISFKKPKAVNHYGKTIAESISILSPYQDADVVVVVDEILEFKNSQIMVDRYQLLNGHDFCDYIPQAIKNIKSINIKKGDIREKLMSKFSISDFNSTVLARELNVSYPGVLL